MPLRLILTLVGLGLLLAACDGTALLPPDTSASPAPATSPIPTSLLADNCLVGKWIGVNQSSYTTKGTLAGYAGAVLIFTATGLETTDYSNAQSASGTQEGQSVVSTLHGAWTFQDTAIASRPTAPGTLTRVSVSSSLSQTIVIANNTTTSFHVQAKPVSTLQYSCTAKQLVMHVYLTDPKGEFQDVYTRAK